MAKKKTDVRIVTLRCTEDGRSAYQTKVNKRTHTDRLELRKYSKFLRRYTLHREVKK